jgi:uncharacterized protein YprB with RNaseH-like and TPR domain
MLRQTFLHLPGVGEATERRWWREGILDWEAALARPCKQAHRIKLEQSVAAFAKQEWRWFDEEIENAHKWRAWGDLADRALCVDIETNGGSGPESITIIGTFDGRETRAFVADENLQDAADYLEGFPLLVTFNGLYFDMPLMRSRFTHRLRNHLHLDLRLPLRQLGLRGGLKRIEIELGIERGVLTRGLGGWDAVRLWREWQAGSREARELLLMYNADDVQSLRTLAEWMHARLRESVMNPQP